MSSVQIWFPLLLSLLLPVFLYALRRCSGKAQLWMAVSFATAKFLALASLVKPVLGGANFELVLFDMVPGVSLALRVDPFGLLFALVASFLWILASFYSYGYLTSLGGKHLLRFFSFFSWAMFATVGAAFAANLFTLYVFYELLSLSTWPLVAHQQDEESRRAGRRYLAFLLGSSIGLLLPAMIVAYLAGTSVDFSQPSLSPEILSGWRGFGLFLMFLFGFAKAAIMPLHSWLPNAMVAPTPVSALLHAVAVVKVGVFGILRVVTGVFGVDLLSATHWEFASASQVMVILAVTTMLLSGCLAYSQKSLKGLLAYSTIGQLAYIILAIGILSPQGTLAGGAHIAFHAFGKITLFFCAGAIYVATGFKRIDQLNGIGRRMPITMIAFVVGAATVIGIPPTSGFLSKWYLVEGCVAGGHYLVLIAVMISTLLKMGYFAPLVFRAFYMDPVAEPVGERESSLYCVIPPVVTATLSFLLIFNWHPLVKLAELGVSRLY